MTSGRRVDMHGFEFDNSLNIFQDYKGKSSVDNLLNFKLNFDKKTNAKIGVLASVLGQIASVVDRKLSDIQVGMRNLLVYTDLEEFFNIHGEAHSLSDIIRAFEVLKIYDRDLFQYKVGWGVDSSGRFSLITPTKITSKDFYSKILLAIKEDLCNSQTSGIFEVYRNKLMDSSHPDDPNFGKKFSEINGFEEEFAIDENYNDLELRALINQILGDVLGPIAFLSLKSGMLSLDRGINGELQPVLLSLYGGAMLEALNVFGLGLLHYPRSRILTKFSHIESYENVFSSLFSSGYNEKLEVYYFEKGNLIAKSEKTLETDFTQNSVLIKGIVDNTFIPKLGMSNLVKIRDLMISHIEKQSNPELENKLFVRGKLIFTEAVKKMLNDQVKNKDILHYFSEEINIMEETAKNRGDSIKRSELIKIKKSQVIDYLSRIYVWRVYHPSRMPQPSNLRSMGDFAQWLQNVLSDQALLVQEVPFTVPGIGNMNDFFKTFKLKFNFLYFSAQDILTLTQSIEYKTIHFVKGKRFIGQETVDNLYSVKAISGELKEKIGSSIKYIINYFKEYITDTGIDMFLLRFILPKAKGFYDQSYLRNTIPKAFQSSEISKGNYLGYKVSRDGDLKKMVGSLVYYMVKYACIVPVSEVSFDKEGNILEKYALVPSQTGNVDNNYLRSGQKVNFDLYRETSEYLAKNSEEIDTLLKTIWGDSIYFVYLLKDVDLIKDYIESIIGGEVDDLVDIDLGHNFKEYFLDLE